MSKEVLCIILLVVFFAIMIYVGFYSRKHATDVNGFVLGGRGVGPWLTAFAFGTSYFSAVIFVGYAGQFGWNFGLASTEYQTQVQRDWKVHCIRTPCTESGK